MPPSEEPLIRLYKRRLPDRADELIGTYPASSRHRQTLLGTYKRADELDAGDVVEGLGRLSRVSRVPEEVSP